VLACCCFKDSVELCNYAIYENTNCTLMLLFSEFEVALNELKNRKSEGPDGLPGDLLKASGSKGKQESFEICNQIHERGEWPKEFLESIIIPIDKRCGAHDCVDVRTISLVSHASNTVLKVLTRRLESKAELFLERDQYGFRKGKGTRDAIAAIRVMCERRLKHNKKVYMCYVDYEKTFDRVDWVKL